MMNHKRETAIKAAAERESAKEKYLQKAADDAAIAEQKRVSEQQKAKKTLLDLISKECARISELFESADWTTAQIVKQHKDPEDYTNILRKDEKVDMALLQFCVITIRVSHPHGAVVDEQVQGFVRDDRRVIFYHYGTTTTLTYRAEKMPLGQLKDLRRKLKRVRRKKVYQLGIINPT